MAGVHPPILKPIDPRGHTETVLSDPLGVEVSITSERGETNRYQAQSVTLQIVRGGIEVLQDQRGTYAWFERCRLEARAGRKRLVLSLASGVVSSCGKEMTIVAAFDSGAHVPSNIPARNPREGVRKNQRRAQSKSS